MLIDSQPQQSSTPPTPQLQLSHNQSMVSSPSPQTPYDMVERLKQRVEKYRLHHQITYQKNENTVDSQNVKTKAETIRLQQQFLNNNHNNSNNKSKQQKSVNASTNQRNANKRSNASANNCDAKCESSDAKVSKMGPKGANSRANSVGPKGSQQLSPSNQSLYRNNCSKFNAQSNQMDVKIKPLIATSCVTTNSPQIMIANNSAPEIKREIVDNSYFESVTVDAIHDILSNNAVNAQSNGCAANGMEMFGSDVMKDLFNDTGLTDDGLGVCANFGDEDFITKFLEEINDSSFNDLGNSFAQQMTQQNSTPLKPQITQQITQQISQPMVSHSNSNCMNTNSDAINGSLNCNINVNLMNNNSNANINNSNTGNNNTMIMNNQMNFSANQLQTNPDMSAYHPIQPRLQPTLQMSSIPNRPSLQMMSSNNPNFTTNVMNSNNVRNYVSVANTGPQALPQQQLLLQQITPLVSQQSISGVQIQSQPQSSQPIHLRLPVGSVPRMGIVSVVPKSENNVSVQLSIQVPQQTITANSMSSQIPQTSAQTSQAAANASIKLKQMAQQVQQQKTHQWVINHSNTSLSPMPQQMPQQSQQQMTQSPQRLTPQIRQQLQPQQQQQQHRQVMQNTSDTQNTNQIQTQMQNQTQTYFTPQMSQQIYWQQSQQQPQQHIQSQPQQQQQQQNIQQNPQHYDNNYWSHPQQMTQMGGQPSQQTPQTQQLYNNYNNNYNYF